MPIRKIPVDLDELATALETVDRSTHEWYLDKKTGEVVLIETDLLGMAEMDEDEEKKNKLPEWQRENLVTARQIVENANDRFERVPEGNSRQAYELMEEFIAEVPDPAIQERLERAIAGKGAFRRFKNELFDFPEVREQWFAFESRRKWEWAGEWLEELGIESTWEPPARAKPPPAEWRPSIAGVHHVQISIPVGSEDAARQFYCKVLALPEIAKPPALQTRGGLWVQAGNLPIHIGVESDPHPSAKAHVAYQVADLNKWRDRLQKSGVKIIESVPIPGFNRFEFRDPFGNRIEFIQPVAG